MILLFFGAVGLSAVPESTILEGSIPAGFSGIELGMTLEQVKEVLEGHLLFDYRGDPIVSLLAEPNRSLIDCRGTTYIERALFQFRNEELYIITLMIDPEQLDYYTLYTRFTNQYGITEHVRPNDAVWEDVSYRLRLEKPLTVKYVDKAVFEAIREEQLVEESQESLSREEFLDLF